MNIEVSLGRERGRKRRKGARIKVSPVHVVNIETLFYAQIHRIHITNKWISRPCQFLFELDRELQVTTLKISELNLLGYNALI